MSSQEVLKRLREAKESEATSLSLDGLGLTSVPVGVAELTTLWRLDLSRNALTSLPPELARLEKLEILDLRENPGLTRLPFELAKLSNLLDLYLEDTGITTVPKGLHELVDLPPQINPVEEARARIYSVKVSRQTALSLRGLGLSEVPPGIVELLAELRQLETLDLSENQLADLNGIRFRRMKKLRELDVRKNALTRLPSSLVGLKSLQAIRVEENPIQQVPDETLSKLTGLPYVAPEAPPEEVPAKVYEGAAKKRQGKLVRAIVGAPEASEPRAAYAAWLSEQGDPRGELIRLQTELEGTELSDEGREGLERDARLALLAGQRGWLGALADLVLDPEDWDITVHWRRGFVDAIEVPEVNWPISKAIKRFEALGMVRRLRLGPVRSGHEAAYSSLCKAAFPSLRVLEVCEVYGARLRAFVELVERSRETLREIWVGAGAGFEKLFRADLPQLHRLSLFEGMTYQLEDLLENESFQELRELRLHPHTWREYTEESGYMPLEEVRTVARATNLPSLRVLGLRRSTAGDEGVRAFVESDLLAQLEELDLSYGEVTDAGAEMLATRADAIRGMRIVLDYNCLTMAGIQPLLDAGVNLSAESQAFWGEGRGFLTFEPS